MIFNMNISLNFFQKITYYKENLFSASPSKLLSMLLRFLNIPDKH